MYGPPGRAYVYLVYGMYDCLNIVTERAGHPAALLVRAVEPLTGFEAMRAARLERWRSRRRAASADADASEADRLDRLPDVRLASGPGLVAAAFAIDRSLTGTDLTAPASRLRIELTPADDPPPSVATGPRLGIDYAGSPWTDVPWRFWLNGHPSVSGTRRRDRRPAS